MKKIILTLLLIITCGESSKPEAVVKVQATEGYIQKKSSIRKTTKLLIGITTLLCLTVAALAICSWGYFRSQKIVPPVEKQPFFDASHAESSNSPEDIGRAYRKAISEWLRLLHHPQSPECIAASDECRRLQEEFKKHHHLHA